MSRPRAQRPPEKPIIFFDGVCNLCNGFVNFLIAHDAERQFYFSALQGETAKTFLSMDMIRGLESVVLIDQEGTHVRSTAAIRILSLLGGAWKLANVLILFPIFIRDPLYTLIANNRYRIWGKKESCRLPSPEERNLFLP